MNGVIDGYFGDPRVLRETSNAIGRIGDDLGLQPPLIRRAGDSAAVAVGDDGLAAAIRDATSHIVMAVNDTSDKLGGVGHFGRTQAATLLRAFGELDA